MLVGQVMYFFCIVCCQCKYIDANHLRRVFFAKIGQYVWQNFLQTTSPRTCETLLTRQLDFTFPYSPFKIRLWARMKRKRNIITGYEIHGNNVCIFLYQKLGTPCIDEQDNDCLQTFTILFLVMSIIRPVTLPIVILFESEI